jgi:glycosyltransferase involved in cell wall biosynthesis
MRVCYVTMGFPLDVETFACTDVRMLRAAGVDVTVCTMLRAAPDAERMLVDRGLAGLHVNYATLWAYLRGLWRMLLHPLLLVAVVSLILRQTWKQPRFLVASLVLLPRTFDIAILLDHQQVDVVHLFWGHYPALVLYLLQRRRSSVVSSMFLGAYDLVYGYGPSRIVARQADVVWTHAKENVPVIAGLGVAPDRVHVVHRGIDLDVFRAERKIAHRVVCAARLCFEKHVDDVLHAFAQVREMWPAASLVILGDGPERPRLETLCEALGIRDAVMFRGHVPHHVVRDEMAVAECFVLMSRENTERLTNAIKEAMACECVVVVTRSPGLDEMLTDGVDGFVIEPAAVDRAAQHLDWAFREADDARAVGRRAARRIKSGFDVVQAMAAYQRRWNELLQPDAGRHAPAAAARRLWSPSSSTNMVL